MVSRDGTRVGFLTQGHGRPLVIVPGTLARPEMYRALTQPLSDRYTVVVVGRRGYGLTGRGPEPARFADQVEDLDAVLGELAEPVVLFGHSFGGLVGLAAGLGDPARITGITLYEPPLALLGDVLRPMLLRCRSAADDGRPGDAVRISLAAAGSPTVREDGPDRTHLAELVPGLVVDLECATGMTMPVECWAGMTAPMVLLRGERTTAEYARSVEMVRALYPDARYEVLPGEAHFPRNMDRIAAILAA